MEVKIKLERVLQMLTDVERVDALSDIERDMILADLREAYAAVKFGKTEEKEDAVTAPVVEQSAAPVAAPEQQDEAEEDEPEMEFEIIFNEEENEEDEADEAPVAETPVVETPIFEQPVVEQSAAQPLFEQQVDQSAFVQHVEPQPIVLQPVPQYQAVEHQSVEMNNATNANPLASHISSFGTEPSRRSPILSLYEDAAPVVGDQFREMPSVADTISCPKGVAESAPVFSLRSSIGMVDRYMLIQELFDGRIDAYEAAIDALEMQPSFEDCVIYITENYSWRAQSEGTRYMMELLQRKYNA